MRRSAFNAQGRLVTVVVPGEPTPALPLECPGCSGIVKRELGLPVGLGRCSGCSGLVGEVTYETFHATLRSLETWCRCGNVPFEQTRYFDLTIIDAVPAPQRFHGWFDTSCGCMTQEG